MSGAARKITVQLPEDLLRRALNATGEGLTSTVKQGLEVVAASHAYEELRKLRGKIKISLSLKELRKDRR